MKIFYLLFIALLFSCSASRIDTNEIRLSLEEKKEILGLQEYLLWYKATYGFWPNELKLEKNYSKNYKELKYTVSFDSVKVEFEILKNISDSTKIRSLSGRFNIFLNEKNVTFVKNFPIKVELKNGVVLFDRNRIKSQ